MEPRRHPLRWLRPVAAGLLVPAVTTACTLVGADPELPDAQAGSWGTWVVDDVAALEVGEPPVEGSSRWRADEQALGRVVAAPSGEAAERIARWDVDVGMRPWLEVAWRAVAQESKQVPRSSRAYGLLTAAMYEASAAAWHFKGEFQRAAPQIEGAGEAEAAWSYPSARAAAEAAWRVLAETFPEQPAPRLEQMAEEAGVAQVEAGAAYPSDVDAGRELGAQVAEAVLAHAEGDGFELEWDGQRPQGTEYWDPPPGSSARPDAPRAGEWATWYLPSGDALRADPPPEVSPDNAAFMEQVEAVVAVADTRTDAQRQFAIDWEGPEGTALPAGLWTQEAMPHVAAADWSLPRQAWALALLNTAMHDAAVAVWDSKYAYWYPRPVNIIREFGIDEAFEPLLFTPFFPAYPSGNNGYAGAAAEVLAYLFSDDEQAWRKLAERAGASRLWGEVHWPIDNTAGFAMGTAVGEQAVDHARDMGVDR